MAFSFGEVLRLISLCIDILESHTNEMLPNQLKSNFLFLHPTLNPPPLQGQYLQCEALQDTSDWTKRDTTSSPQCDLCRHGRPKLAAWLAYVWVCVCVREEANDRPVDPLTVCHRAQPLT